MNKLFFLVFLSAVAACGPSGGGADAAPEAGPVTYEQIQAIYNRSCATFNSCHNSSGMRGDLDLTASASYADTVNVDSIQAMGMKIVAPGNPANSYLLHKLEGTMNTIPICMMRASEQLCGTRMPMVGGMPLSAEDIALFRSWIAAGAPGPSGGSAMDAGAMDASASGG